MNKGTAILGFFLCFLTGMGLMYAVERSKGGVAISAEPSSGGTDHSSSPLPVSSKDPQWGNSDALVTIVQFSDFQCPFCSRVEPTITQIKQTYKPEQVRVVWKNSPLPFHNHARPAADAAETVFNLKGNDAFWKFHDILFSNQQALDEGTFEKWATDAGVDPAKFTAAYKAKTYTAKVDQDLALAQKVGANGTPSFRINGKTVSGAQPFDKFKEVIEDQLKAADDLVKSGTKRSEVSLALTKKNFEGPKDNPSNPSKPSGGAGADDGTTVNRINIAADDPIRGPKDAPVTIVEFSDFQCPFCARVEPTLKQVVDTYKNDVRIVWKDNALPFHNRAKQAANFARAAYAKGGNSMFWKAHDEIYANQKDIEDTGLQVIAKTIGLDWDTAKAAIDGNKYGDKISSSINQADDVGASGTPHFFINGRRLVGAKPFDAFKTVIDDEMTKAKALIKNGVAADKVYDEIMKSAKSAGEPEKRDVVEPTKNDPVRGNASASIVIQEFSDFQCPFCGKVEPTLKQLLDEYAGKVKLVWHDMPLPFHQNAPLAAEAAYEVFLQKGNDAFWQYHDKLYANQQAIAREDLEKYAQELGVDMAKFKAALDSHKNKAHIDANTELAKKAGVNGTPAFTVNGYFLSGAQPYEKFEKMVKYAMNK